jgi:uncharacterized membrane protein YozB (DUF420 family)
VTPAAQSATPTLRPRAKAQPQETTDMLTDWNAILASLAIVLVILGGWNLWRGERLTAAFAGFTVLTLIITIIENMHAS